MKAVMLCADDFALNSAVDDAILQLAEVGILQAISCMTRSPRWPSAAIRLRALPNQPQVGLHIDLTEGFGSRLPGIGALIIRSYLRLLSREKLAESLGAQLDAFIDQYGRPPDFIDGHQHVHQLPMVRDVLLELIDVRFRSRGLPLPWVRNTVPVRSGLGRKAGLLSVLGGRSLRDRLASLGIPTNTGFAGVYGFDCSTPEEYGVWMQLWLRDTAPGLLVMCHPGCRIETGDAITHARITEYAWLLEHGQRSGAA